MRAQVADRYRLVCRACRTSPVAPPADGTASLDGAPASRRPWCGPRLRARRCPRSPSAAPPQHGCRRSTSTAVAAPVRPERALHTRGFRSLEVGDDVAAAERVDGLLRITDEDQRGAARECPVDHLPLHRIGVLEFVDHDDRPPRCIRMRGCAGESSGCERGGQPGQQVVVAEDAQLPFAGVPARPEHFSGEARRIPPARESGSASTRPQFGAGIALRPRARAS